MSTSCSMSRFRRTGNLDEECVVKLTDRRNENLHDHQVGFPRVLQKELSQPHVIRCFGF